MKDEMRAFDVLAVVREAQSLVGGFVDKVFHWEGGNVLIRINVKGEWKKELYLKGGKWLYLAPTRPQVPDFPEQFAVHLRKMISNARVEAVNQFDFDRIVVIDLMRGDSYQLVIELFGDGNLLLVKDGSIVNCLFSRRWRDREVRPGAEYQFPRSRFNPLTAERETLLEILQGSDSDVVRTLATKGNLGGQYAEEVCLITGVDKSRKANLLDREEGGRLFDSMMSLLDRLGESIESRVVFDGEEMVDVTPLPLMQHSGLRAEEYPTFSEAVHEYLGGEPEEPETTDKALLKLQRQWERQRESIDKRTQEAEELATRAEEIYMHYQEVSDLLSALKGMVGSPWESIREFCEEQDMVRSVDPSKHRVSVQLERGRVRLDYELGIDANANLLYQRSKELKGKASRAEEALKETEVRIERRRKGLAREEESRGGATPTKQFWFERYKWFITEGGRLVISGRDARTNDQVVKKHLKPEDRYAHADVHGAPSVVLKQGSEATEEELHQVCSFALAHSKAWNASISEGSAYWVLPDQVSKAPITGEFVPRGAFIIRGRRNYFHHLVMEMAVGEIEYERERKIMCSPRETMENASERYVVITPGKESRSKLSSSLARRFEVPEEEISRVLPPGDVRVTFSKGIFFEE
jgi:predicted ribosome quality control (RQC) complex YloA/Tae2 family protein